MSEGPANLVARHVHDLIERQRLDALPDHALLRRFLDRDDAAFAALVRRHGPLVLGTCRRILRHAQDAEDACQAVFLVLARKGRMVRGEALAGWLHRVAVRAAGRLRRQLVRQSTEPLPAEPQVPAPAGDELVWREVRQTFDTEVGRLPDRLRLPVVLCCLQGKTRSEAAAELGWTEGTVRGRLERGRKLLRSRFTRKGLTVPATLLPLLAAQGAPATTPADLVTPSTAAARLADGVVRSMAVARAKLAAWATAAVLVVGTAIGVGVYRPAVAQPKAGDAPPAVAESPPPTAAQAERNLDTFTLRVSLAPAGEGKYHPKYSLYHVLLHVPNLRFEPPANGPDGKPVEAHARITQEQAKKIVDALAGFDFFKDDSAFADPLKARLQLMQAGNWPHVGIAVRFQNGEDAARLERRLAWLPTVLPPLDALRGCVDGDAAKALDQLLGQLAEDRRKWTPDPLADDLKKLQGSWAVEPPTGIQPLGTIPAHPITAKCVIEGKNITFKPVVQVRPLLDLETIRGTFELSAGTPRRMTIKGVRETVSKREAGTWEALYDVSDTTLRLRVAEAGAPAPAGWKTTTERAEREFTLKRVTAGAASEWGEASNHLQARLRTAKSRYTAGEVPAFDLDVRDRHAGIAGKPWHWLAPRVGQIARVEVDGVWYRPPPIAFKKLSSHPLQFGETIEAWATVHLTDDYWIREGDEERGGRRLVLKPGKHRVRVSYDFSANEGGHTARPVTGAVEFEVVAGRPMGHGSDWGEPSRGVQTRVRAAKAVFAAGEAVTLELDAKAAAGAGRDPVVWRPTAKPSPVRIELDGVWYNRVPDEAGKASLATLTEGEQVDRWAALELSDEWVREYYTGIPPGEAGRPLKLGPGKHVIRVVASFTRPGLTADPVSRPLEIEVTAPAKAPAPAGWKAQATWVPHGPGGVQFLGAAGDYRLYTAHKSGLVQWNLIEKSPKAENKVDYIINGLQVAGIDRDGYPLLFRQVNHPRPGGNEAELTVLRLPDFDDKLPPTVTVKADDLRAWAVSPDGTTLALMGYGWDSVRLIDVGSRKERRLDAPKGDDRPALPQALMFTRDTKRLVGLGSNDYPVIGRKNGRVACWDTATGRVLWHSDELAGHGIGTLSRNGRTLVTGGSLLGPEVVVWDVESGNKLARRSGLASALAIAPDGGTVLIGTQSKGDPGKGLIQVWDLASNEPLAQSIPVPAPIRAISYDDSGRAFATADSEGEVRWWAK